MGRAGLGVSAALWSGVGSLGIRLHLGRGVACLISGCMGRGAMGIDYGITLFDKGVVCCGVLGELLLVLRLSGED